MSKNGILADCLLGLYRLAQAAESLHTHTAKRTERITHALNVVVSIVTDKYRCVGAFGGENYAISDTADMVELGS